MEMRPNKFTIRVYGILQRGHEVLVAEEMHKGRRMNKFPGGGLEPGEGTAACVVREFLEETGVTVEVRQHFYTTDFFVASAFDPQIQVISIYYLVSSTQPFEPPRQLLEANAQEDEIFRWVDPLAIDPVAYFTFPIDQHVGKLLQTWMEAQKA